MVLFFKIQVTVARGKINEFQAALFSKQVEPSMSKWHIILFNILDILVCNHHARRR